MKTVLANGVFDLLHYGHVQHLEAAKKLGDKLVVSITDDRYVNKFGRPIYTSQHRAGIVAGLRCVDEVIIVRGLEDALRKVQPHILAKGSDYAQGIDAGDKFYCDRFGIEIQFTQTPKFSTTDTIDEIRRRS